MTAQAVCEYNHPVATRKHSRRPPRQYLTDDAISNWVFEEPAVSAVSVAPSPEWVPHTYERLNDLLSLKIGWDGHDGRPVRADIADFALFFLLETLESDGPAPQILPTSYGGVQLEWHKSGVDLEIELIAPNRIFVSFEDHETGKELEKEFSTDYTEVAQIMRELASRETR